MSSEKRGSVSRRGVRLRGEESDTATSIPGKDRKVVVTEWEVGGLEGWEGGTGSWKVRAGRRWFAGMWGNGV